MTEEISAVVIEFGGRGHLTEDVILEMKDAPRMVAEVYPDKPIMIALAGYDDDPRELYEIPEAADYIRRFAVAAGLTDWRTPMFESLVDECKALLIACNAVDPGHGFTVVRT